MRTIFLIIYIISAGFVHAQSKLKPLTEEEIMYSDKLNGTLVSWTEKQKENFISDCESKMAQILKNNKRFCKCSMKSMMTGVNYTKYDKATDYQKGRLTSLHGKLNCTIVRKEE